MALTSGLGDVAISNSYHFAMLNSDKPDVKAKVEKGYRPGRGPVLSL
jgi:hypothetical protein